MRFLRRTSEPQKKTHADILPAAYRQAWKGQRRRAVRAELALWGVLTYLERECRLDKLQAPTDVAMNREDAREVERLIETALGLLPAEVDKASVETFGSLPGVEPKWITEQDLLDMREKYGLAPLGDTSGWWDNFPFPRRYGPKR